MPMGAASDNERKISSLALSSAVLVWTSCSIPLVDGLEAGLTVCGGHHLAHTLKAGRDQKDVDEDHPARVLERTPDRRREHTEDRLGPDGAANQMVGCHHERGGDQNRPVAIKGKKGQRAEDEEVRLDPSARELDQQPSCEHLTDRHGVSREHRARLETM